MQPRPKAAIPSTKPHFSHLEAEWLMEVLLYSDHPEKDYLVNKLVEGGEPAIYGRLRDRVQAKVTLNRSHWVAS